jgi:hypothetical protein
MNSPATGSAVEAQADLDFVENEKGRRFRAALLVTEDDAGSADRASVSNQDPHHFRISCPRCSTFNLQGQLLSERFFPGKTR